MLAGGAKKLGDSEIKATRSPAYQIIVMISYTDPGGKWGQVKPATVHCDSSRADPEERELTASSGKDAGSRRYGKVRVLLADNHEAILAQVRTLLDEEFEIVGAVNKWTRSRGRSPTSRS